MTDTTIPWEGVVWTEAWQVTAPQDWPREPGDTAAPDAFFATLRAAGRGIDAARFLAHALPRMGAIGWLRATIAAEAPAADRASLAAIDAWLRAPDDAGRRAAFDCALPLPAEDPAKLCAAAVMFSGGSLAPDALPATPAPKHAAAQFVAAGVLLCTAAAIDPAAALDRALDAGAARAIPARRPD